MGRKVAEYQDNATHGAIGLADRRTAIVDRHFASVFPDQKHMIRQAADRSAVQNVIDRTLDRLPRFLVDNAKNLHARPLEGLTRAPSGQFFSHQIEKGDASLEIGDDHGVADAR